MKKQNTASIWSALGALAAFALWTILVEHVDVQPLGPNGSCVGLAAINGAFHALTGVHWTLYTLTDWLGLVLISFVLPAVLTWLIAVPLRRWGWIKDGDLKLDL